MRAADFVFFMISPIDYGYTSHMSAIASLHVVSTGTLSAFNAAKSATEFFAILSEQRTTTIDYEYGGWILGTLLPVLQQDFNIDLMRAHAELAAHLSCLSGGTVFLLTDEERQAYSDGLDPALFSAEKLQEAYEAFNETAADGVGEVMREGIRFLRAGLQTVTPDTITVLSIG